MQNGEKGEFKYRIEAARNLAREGIVTEPVTDDILHVTLGGKRLCWVTDRGDIGYYREGDVEHDVAHGEDAVSAAVLGDKGEAFVDRVRPAVRNKFLAVQTGDAAGASADAEDGLHQLRPPCAHQSHHAKNLTPANLKGCPPQEFLIRLRLSKAADLLRTTTASIGDICASCGYPNQLYFSQAFKQHYGLSPREWRAQNKMDRHD